MSTTQQAPELTMIGSVGIEIVRRGSGPPLLILPSEEGFEAESAVVADLARDHEVIIPYAPGFGRSQRPDWITNPDDIAYVMLDLTDALLLRDVPVVGFSIGGWIAAAMATKSDSFASKLVLVDAFGIKLGGAYDRDIADIWLLHPSKVTGLKWSDPEKGKRDYSAWSDEELSVVARNMESFARFCWEPYMHDTKLKHLLHRIKKPTLLLWGENDGVTPVSYGEGYAALISGARLRRIPEAGHFPHVEQPQAFLRELRAFID